MAGLNFRDTYGFDPDDYSGGGGLPGMLWRAMQEQGVLQPGVGVGSGQAGAPGQLFGVHDLPGGFLGGLLALQGLRQPPAGDNEARSSEAQDPNFRQLVRVNRSESDLSNRSDSQSEQRYGSLRGDEEAADASTGGSSPYQMQTRQPGGSVGADNDRSGPSSGGGAPTTMAQVVIPGRLPPPWPAPTSSSPQIPMPDVPDWLRDAWTLLLRKGRGFGGGGGRRSRPRDDYDEDDCDERHYAELARCDARYDDIVHPHYLSGCKERADERWRKCYKNGRKPDPSEPPEWGPGDEETYRNYGR